MLNVLTPSQVAHVISLLHRLAQSRTARAAEGKQQSPDEIINDPERRLLTHYYTG
jgi:hypothetical protein